MIALPFLIWATLMQLSLIAGEKSGTCPIAYGGRSEVTPVDRCHNDNDCPGKRKCCQSLIGRACMLPEMGTTFTTSNQGYNNPVCPVTLPTTFSHMEHVCFGDADCKGGRRCCRYGGVRRCLSSSTTGTTIWATTRPTTYRTTLRPDISRPQQGGGSRRCTGENEEYTNCAPLCPKGCDNMRDEPNCPGCKPGCKCMRGYHRLVVDDSKSPCIANQVCLAMTSKRNCPDGSVPQAVCRGKYTTCPAQTSCMNGLCCSRRSGGTGAGGGGGSMRPQPNTKPGVCPSSPPFSGSQSRSCSQDNQCYGNQKCCYTYSGRVCLSPEATSTRPSYQKPNGNNNLLGGVMNMLGLGNLGSLMNVG